jgi:RHS repeat-associated protein
VRISYNESENEKISNYYPFGEEISPLTPQNRDKFATYFRDGTTGLDYAMNRYYGSPLARFLTPDPYGGSASPGNPQSWNRYAHVADDPINGFDPTGLDCASNIISKVYIKEQSGKS